MDEQQIIDDLRKTLSDYRLTRSEKRALQQELKNTSNADRNRLRHEVFELASQEILSPDAVEIVSWLKDTVKLMLPHSEKSARKSEVLFSPENNCVAKICALLMQARKSIDICVFTITDDRIASAIIAAHKRNAKVRIVTDDEKAHDLGSDIFHLKDKGIPIRTDKTPDHMHHKYAVFDKGAVVTGSYNWTRNASMRNEENLVVSYESQLVGKFAEHFDSLWQKFR